jgi:hypothetical protein
MTHAHILRVPIGPSIPMQVVSVVSQPQFRSLTCVTTETTVRFRAVSAGGSETTCGLRPRRTRWCAEMSQRLTSLVDVALLRPLPLPQRPLRDHTKGPTGRSIGSRQRQFSTLRDH